MKKKLMMCLIVLLSAGCLGFRVNFQKLAPACQDIPASVKSVSVLDFEGDGGKVVADMLANGLLKKGFYIILSGDVEADAVITGSVSGYKVETARGSLVLTPATYDAEGHITTFATYRYFTAKSAKVGINYRMTKDGKLIASKYVAKSYNSGKQYDDDPAYFALASDEAILNGLVSDLTSQVVPEFSPHLVLVKRRIQKGKTAALKEAYNLAKDGKWGEAISAWEKVLAEDPVNVVAKDNLAVVYEREGARRELEKRFPERKK